MSVAVQQLSGLAVGILGGIVFLTAQPLNRLTAQDYRAQAIRILGTVPLIDGHNDIPDAIRERGGLDSVNFGVSQPRLMTDVPRLRAGHVGGQFWAAYVPVTTMDSGTHPATYALEQIDLTYRLCSKNARSLAMAYTAADVERNFAAGKVSCLIGIEGGHAIENSLGALRMFYKLGTRYMTLTHWRSLDWATASTDTARRGLSPFGKQVVLEMNRLGMLVDLSHVNDQTMSDALHTSRAPVIFSHSSARALANHARNVPDSATRADSLKAWDAAGPHATLSQVADHIEHIRQVAGIDCVGIGSDFDGITEVPVGMEDVSKFPDLIAELLRRGW